MISIEGVPEKGASLDVFEGSLIYPIPGQEKNTVVLEDRDGTNIQRLTAKSAELELNAKTVFKLSDVKIDIFVTDARVAFACSKFEKGEGWLHAHGEYGIGVLIVAGSKARAAFRRRGKMMVGQVRYPWIQSVGSTARTGWRSEERLFFNAKASEDDSLRLVLTLPKDIDAAQAAAEITRRASAYRLTAESELDEEERSKLEELGRANPLPPDPTAGKNDARYFEFPTFWFMNEQSARLLPAASAGDGSPQQSHV